MIKIMWRKGCRIFGLSILLLSGLLMACVSSTFQEEPEQVSVRLKWLHQTQFAGLYVAEQEGYYADEQLAVTLEPVDFEQRSPVDKVLAGENDFGIDGSGEIIIARSEGKPVRALAVIYRITPSIFLVKPDAGIRSPQDFLGQKIAISPGDASVLYRAMMESLQLDRSQIEETIYTGFDLWECWDIAPVCPNYATNGPILLRQAKQDFELIWPGDYGVSWYGDILFTSDQMIAEKPEVVERFVRATLRGWQQAIEDPELAIAATLIYGDDLDEAFQREAMRASIPLIDTGEFPIGQMEAQTWQNIHDILLTQGIISEPLDLDTVYTNEFIEKVQ